MFRRALQHALKGPLRQQQCQLISQAEQLAAGWPCSISGVSSSSSSSAASASSRVAHGRTGQWSGTVRHFFSSAEGAQGGASSSSGPRSILDSSLPHTGAAGTALSGTAAARLKALSAAEAASGSGEGGTGAAAGAPRSLARRALSALFDASILASLAALAAGGYTYYRYSVPEVQEMLGEAYEAQQQAGGPEGASLGSQAWVKALEAYLAVAVPLDAKVREYTDPRCASLLPEQAPELRGHLKTLVLDLEGVLVHKEWSRAKGWQVLKRPGVEAFLLEMGRRYEVVIYTDELPMYADPVINRIDPHGAVMYRLYRPDTQYHNGKHVRDLSKLNRDLSQVLFISAEAPAYEFQPENALKLKPWDHTNLQDTTLLDLIPFLQMVQEVHVNDVRDVVRSFDGEEDVAAAFKQRMSSLEKQKRSGGGRLGRLRN